MKRLFISLILVAAPVVAQKNITDPAKAPVAVVDGEVITAEKLDWMWNHLPSEVRAQYARSGGKGALLENYIGKRLVIHQAQKTGFDKNADVQRDIEAAKESTLFDRYVRDVVAPTILSESAMQQYYEQHEGDFREPEMIKLREIFIAVTDQGRRPHSDEQAKEIAKKALTDVLLTIPRGPNPAANAAENAKKFAAIARTYSEDALASAGGDFGWIAKGQIDPALESAAFTMPAGVPSGIIRGAKGYLILFIEGKRAAGTLSFDEAKPRIRDTMLKERSADIIAAVNRLTDDLSDKMKVEVHPENIR